MPEILEPWLRDGHRVAWAHDQSALVRADFCFYLGYGKIVPSNILNMFKHNLVVHESDLPKGKGWSPLTWQILEGKKRIPVTLIEADKEVDSGIIYAQEWLDLQGGELVDDLRRLQAVATMTLCERFVKNYPEILKQGRKQRGQESFYVRRYPEDSQLDPDKTIREQFNLLRVVDNEMYPAFFVLRNQRYKITIERE